MIDNGCEFAGAPSFQCLDPEGARVESFAVFECCECGGGVSEEPEGWELPLAKQVFVQ